MNDDTTLSADRSKLALKSGVGNVARGVLMGGADVVPGVSGGTVALILGIYYRLVTAISRFDMEFLRQIRHRRWRNAATHIDLTFLATLALGLATGFITMTLAMHQLLASDLTRTFTWATFFGLIVASCFLVGRLVRVNGPAQLAGAIGLGLVGAVFASWLSTLNQSHVDPSLPYVFVCGLIAICAMILPGISGAMILLIMGVYIHLTDIPHNLLQGEEVGRGVATVAVFAAGCSIGLLSFSKLLKWLLGRYQSPTMAVLCGFMFGALANLWPFQHDLTPEIEKVKYKQFESYLPETLDSQTVAVFATMILATTAVFVIDYVGRKRLKPVKRET